MGLRHARLGYPALAAALIAIYYIEPRARPATVAAIAVLSIAGIGIGVWTRRPQRWAAWVLIAAAVVLLAIGDVVFTILADYSPGPVTYPGVPDVFYLVAYLPLAVGLLWLGRPELPSRDWPMLLDTIALSLAGALVVWIVLVRPAVTSLHLTGGDKVALIASWVGYVAVLAASARVMLAWRTNGALRLLALAVAGFLLADFFYGRQLIAGTWTTGSLIDLGFLAFSVLAGAAALTPSMSRVASAPYARHQLGPLRLLMLAVALLVAPTVLLVQATEGPVDGGVAIASITAAVGIVLLVRLAITARAYRRRAAREHAIRLASRALVLATTEEDVTAGLTNALRDMLPPGLDSHADLIDAGYGPTLVEHDRGRANNHSVCELVVPLGAESAPTQTTIQTQTTFQTTSQAQTQTQPPAHTPGAGATADKASGRAVVFTAPSNELAEVTPVLHAVADQAASALHRIDLVSRLRDEDREKYFRTLVLTSDDVTLISRDGQVVYATPSANTMFGRDVTSEDFDTLVQAKPDNAKPDNAKPDNGSTDSRAGWSDTVTGVEGYVHRDGGVSTVLIRRRDLSDDPTVTGVVTTLRDVTEERRLRNDLAYRASHDQLTGLANGQQFADELRAEESGAPGARETTGGGWGALFVDLDDFKAVNDAHGHQVGDRLLTEVARRIRTCLGPDDLAARLGGDEFAVLLRDVPDVETARRTAQHIADTLAHPAVVDTVVVDCQASIGLAYTDQRRPVSALMREADTALYTAKAHGKGRWRQFREGMTTPTRQHATDRRHLENAIENGNLAVWYQPIVKLASGQPVGFEALVRFHDPEAPMSPQQVIATAEETGMITTVGEWILGQALTDTAKLNPPGCPPCYVTVNVSARQLTQPDFVDVVHRRLAATGADPSALVLEIAENKLIGDDDHRVWAFLANLRREGIRVAIDDYGTGYASLAYLRQPTIDILKLDQAFLADLANPRNLELVKGVTSTCARLGVDEIAEGIQDSATKDALIVAGCPYGQGFLFAHAMPVQEAMAWRNNAHEHSNDPAMPGFRGNEHD